MHVSVNGGKDWLFRADFFFYGNTLLAPFFHRFGLGFTKIGQKSGKSQRGVDPSSFPSTVRTSSVHEKKRGFQRKTTSSGIKVKRIKELLSWLSSGRWSNTVSPVMSNDGVPTDGINPNEVPEEDFMDAQESPNREFRGYPVLIIPYCIVRG